MAGASRLRSTWPDSGGIAVFQHAVAVVIYATAGDSKQRIGGVGMAAAGAGIWCGISGDCAGCGNRYCSFCRQPVAPVALMMSFWLPVIVMAMVLRTTVSLNLALLAGATLALAGVLITYLLVDEPSESWRGLLDAVTQAAEQSTSGAGTDRRRVTEWLNNAGQWMTGFSAATQFILAALSLLLARVWQARLFNPGGLQKEFHGLRFGQAAGAAGLLIVLASVMLQSEILTNLAIVVIVAFAFQGLAVLHALLAQTRLQVASLVGVYVFLLLFSPTSVKIIGLLGLADTWLDIRNRLKFTKKD